MVAIVAGGAVVVAVVAVASEVAGGGAGTSGCHAPGVSDRTAALTPTERSGRQHLTSSACGVPGAMGVLFRDLGPMRAFGRWRAIMPGDNRANPRTLPSACA